MARRPAAPHHSRRPPCAAAHAERARPAGPAQPDETAGQTGAPGAPRAQRAPPVRRAQAWRRAPHRRASHSGRLADYMEMATDAGMIAMGAVSVGSGTTTLYGGMERIIGTHPMAFGIPARNGRPIILDFATASMSMGEIQKRVAKNEPIPDGVILDGHGNPTNDFNDFRGPPRGVFLSFGGHKGSGVALITEILGGLLSGNGLAKHWWDKGGHGINGVFLQAIAVEEFQPLDEFLDRVDELIAFIKSRKTAPGFKEILLPGEQGRCKEARQIREGVEIDNATWTELKKVAVDLGIHQLPKSL